MKNNNILIAIIIAIFIFAIAFFTVPSEIEHRKEVKDNITELARVYAKEELRSQDDLSFFLGSMVLESDAIMETLVDKYITIDINNYGIFSLGYIELPDEEEGKHLVSIGCLGKVFFLADYKDVFKHKKNN